MKRPNTATQTLLTALALGACYNVLFFGQMLGLSVLLFAALGLAALFVAGQWWGVRPCRRNLWLAAPLLFFAGMVAVRANPVLTALNVLACLTLGGLVLYFYADGRLERLGLLGYPLALLAVGVSSFYRAAPLVPASADWGQLREGSKRNVAPVLRGCLLALPVLAVFTGLLASADLIFAHYVQELLALRLLRNLAQYGWRGVLIVCTAWLLAGALVYALQRREQVEAKGALQSAAAALQRTLALGWVETVIILGSVDLLFASFVAIQFSYFFGGSANISGQGFTYAEYARRGFAELVIVAVLALGLILGLRWLARRDSPVRERLFSGLGSALVALVLLTLASAFQRLRLYEAAYGYTELRLYVYTFMVWLGAALLWFLVTLWRLRDRFAVGAFVAALGFLITLNVLNPDALIAQQNLARYQQTGKVDVEYLTTLSEDAAPALLQARGTLPATEQEKLTTHLRERLRSMEQNPNWRQWPAWNLARRQAYQALRGLDLE